MMTCPRCGSNNEAARAACWNCYAPMQGSMASRVKPMLLQGRAPVTVVAEAMEPLDSQEPAPEPKKRGLFRKSK